MTKKRFNILVVDDDQQIIDLIHMFLNMNYAESVNIVTAIDAQMAVLKMSNQEFDLVILDFKMPGRTGVDLATHIKKSLKYSKIPVILMSGALQLNDAIAAIECGIKDILIKPFSMKNLMEKIKQYLELETKDS